MAENITTYRDILTDRDMNEQKSYWKNFKPWENPFVGQKTCTAYKWELQQELIHKKEPPINRDQVAKTLAKRNILRQTNTIQISVELIIL